MKCIQWYRFEGTSLRDYYKLLIKIMHKCKLRIKNHQIISFKFSPTQGASKILHVKE